jgi:hypothetical protein
LWRCLKKEERIEIDTVLVNKVLHRQFVKSVKARVLDQRRKHAASLRPQPSRLSSSKRQAPSSFSEATTLRPLAKMVRLSHQAQTFVAPAQHCDTNPI